MIKEIEMANIRGILIELLCCAYMSVLARSAIYRMSLPCDEKYAQIFRSKSCVISNVWSNGHIFIIYKMDHILFSQ